MSKVEAVLNKYLERKVQRRNQYLVAVEECVERENFDLAADYRNEADKLAEVIWAIEHCIQMVKQYG